MADFSRLSREDLAAAVGHTPRWVTAQVKAGMPSTVEGARRLFDLPACVGWLLARQGPTELEQMRARESELRGDLLDLELAAKRKELMTVGDYTRVVEDTFARVASKLRNLPQQLAPAVVGVRDPSEGLRRVQPVVDGVMRELYEAEDVPTEEVAA